MVSHAFDTASHSVTGCIHPNVDNAFFLKERCDRKMLSSIYYLAGVVEKGIYYDASKILNEVHNCLSDTWHNGHSVSSLVHIQHTRLKYAVENQDIDGAKNSLDILKSIDILTKGIVHGPLNGQEWSLKNNVFIKQSLNNSSIETYGNTMGIQTPSLGKAERMRLAVNKSLHTLSVIDPVLYCEIRVLLTDIVYFDSTQTTSGSSFNCLGLVSMNSISDAQNWTTALEMIVHEAAHQLVYNLMMSDHMILNEESGVYRSALRKDLRPISGIFHALVVLSRIIHIMAKLDVSNILVDEGIKIIPPRNNALNDDPYHSKFYDILGVIEANAELSDVGWEVVESCKKLASKSISSECFRP